MNGSIVSILLSLDLPLQDAPPHVQMILVGNKCDLETKRVVPEEKGRAYTHLHGIPFCETSAKTGHNITTVRKEWGGMEKAQMFMLILCLSQVFEILAKAILENVCQYLMQFLCMK